MKHNLLALLLISTSLYAMDVVKQQSHQPQKRKREDEKPRYFLRSWAKKQKVIKEKEALAKKEQLFSSWLTKQHPHYWQKVKKHRKRGTLSKHGLFYLFTYMPRDISKLIADELVEEVNPYYVARFLGIYPQPERQQAHLLTPFLKHKPGEPAHILCNSHIGCGIPQSFASDVITYIFAHPLTSYTYHQWEFIKKIGQKYNYGYPTFFVQDHESNLTFGIRKSSYTYRIVADEYFNEKRQMLRGKFTLQELLLLKLDQQKMSRVPEDRKKQLDELKTKFKTIFQKEKEEYDESVQ